MKYVQYFDKKLKRKCWRFDFTIGGQRIRRGGFDTKATAERVVLALRNRVEAKRYGLLQNRRSYTLWELLHKRENDAAVANSMVLIPLRWFVDWAGPDVELRSLNQATFKEFAEYLQTEEETDRKNSTISTYLKQLHASLNSASTYFPNFDWTVPRFPRLKIEPGRDRCLSIEELGKILTALDGSRIFGEKKKAVGNRAIAGDLIRLALLVPARCRELMSLKTTDIHTDHMTISIYSPKKNERRNIPLSPIALAILQRHWPGKGIKFFKLSYRPMTNCLIKAAETTGIEYGNNVENGWVFHDLRHTAATAMSSAGVDQIIIAELLGHRRTGITHRYIHPPLEAQRRGIEALEQFCHRIEGYFREGEKKQLTGK